MSRNSWILASSCGGDWGFLFLAIGVFSFLFLILGIAKAATFVTACGKLVHFNKDVRYNYDYWFSKKIQYKGCS